MSLSIRSSVDIFRFLLAAALAVIAIVIVVLTIRWPLVWDAQVFHYTHFLVQNGFVPYRDIPDLNMPGVYLLEDWAMRIFGGSDLGWRIYDFALLGLLTGAMIVISRPYDWLAGFSAGILFALLHVNDGPWNAAERDEVMTVLIVIAYAFLFEAMRRRRPWLLSLFGIALGLAATIKPTVAPLGMVLVIMLAWSRKAKDESVVQPLGYVFAGASAAGLFAFLYLLQHHAVYACWETIRRATPFYAQLDRAGPATLLRFLPRKVEIVMLPFAVAVACTERKWKSWERAALLLGAAFGVLSYLAQGKGYDYHRYPLAAFLLLWMTIELALAMRAAGWRRWVGIAGLAAGVLVSAPLYLAHAARFHADNDFLPIQRDLASLGTDSLQRQVQCLDVVQGCYSALYHLKLVQNTGMVGDILLFATQKSPVVDYYREFYWKQLTTNPPAVIVVTNQWFGHHPSFGKLDQWPAFAAYLQDHYNLVVARKIAHPAGDIYRTQEEDHAYRIYVRKGVSLRLPGNTD